MNTQLENDKLLNYFLDKKFFFSNIEETQRIELIIRPDCNQKCEYCYITQHGEELYPLNERKTKKELLTNINALLKFLLEIKKINIFSWDLFAGDLFYDDLFFDIMDLFYKYYNSEFYQKLLKKNGKNIVISIPTNLSFLENLEKENKFKSYFQKMKDINCFIHLSYSTDGLYAIDVRENKKLTEEWFDKTIKFCADYHFGLHPMVSYESIDNYIENYKWWIKMINKHYSSKEIWSPMFLQVRNNGWNDENIKKYIDLLEYMIDFRLKMLNNNLYDFALHLTQKKEDKNVLLLTPPADLIGLSIKDIHNNTLSCSLPSMLMINCSNLEIVPCHRLSYKQMAAGEFVIENGSIIQIKSLPGFSAYMNIVESNSKHYPGCIECALKDFCMQGCLGSQFEYSGEIFENIPSVCQLFQKSYHYLIMRYKELGVLDIILNPEFENYSQDFSIAIQKYLSHFNEQ